MTTITLPPDVEGRLGEEAQRRGTTPELLAIDGLRQLFPPHVHGKTENEAATLFDFLNGYVGTVAGSTEPLSEDCGKRFGEALVEKHNRGQL
jgi:hypothetical protein